MNSHVHSVPGRVRIRLPRLKGRADASAHVCAGVKRIWGVRSARANHVTGSVIVEYDPAALEERAILEHFVAAGEIPHAQVPRHGEVLGRAAGEFGQRIGFAIVKGAVGMAFEGTALSVLAHVL
jgi:hypothetical protein